MTVYFAQAGEGHPIKIGSAKNVSRRIAALNTASPRRLKLICAIHGDASKERALHAELAAFRMDGEWFLPSPEVLSVVGRESQDAIAVNAPRPPKPYSKLREWREANGITLAALSKTTRLQQSAISMIENGKSRPNWDSMLALYKATGRAITPNDFLPNSEVSA